MYLFHFFLTFFFEKKLIMFFSFRAKTKQPFHTHTLKQTKELLFCNFSQWWKERNGNTLIC
jgi:hypothetical protein